MIDLVKVVDRQAGNLKAYDIIKSLVDSQTLLALSGGTSPDYRKMIVEPGGLVPGAVCVVDERYGLPLHVASNEILIRNFGVWDLASKHEFAVYNFLYG